MSNWRRGDRRRMLFVNSGYSHHGGILPGNVLLAFSRSNVCTNVTRGLLSADSAPTCGIAAPLFFRSRPTAGHAWRSRERRSSTWAGTTVPGVIVIEGDRIRAFGRKGDADSRGRRQVDLSGNSSFRVSSILVHYQPFSESCSSTSASPAPWLSGTTRRRKRDLLEESQSPDFRAPRLFGTGRTNRQRHQPTMTRTRFAPPCRSG